MRTSYGCALPVVEEGLAGERAALVTLSGDLDLSKRDAVADALPAAGSVDRLVVDCSAVTSIESVVIAVFMRYRRKFIAAGSDPMNVVFIVSPQVRRTFEITGMSTFFTVVTASSVGLLPQEERQDA